MNLEINKTDFENLNEFLKENNLWLFKRHYKKFKKLIIATDKGMINLSEKTDKIFLNNFMKKGSLSNTRNYKYYLSNNLLEITGLDYKTLLNSIIQLNEMNYIDKSLKNLNFDDFNINKFKFNEIDFNTFLDEIYNFNKSYDFNKFKLYDLIEDDDYYYLIGYKENNIVINEELDEFKEIINNEIKSKNNEEIKSKNNEEINSFTVNYDYEKNRYIFNNDLYKYNFIKKYIGTDKNILNLSFEKIKKDIKASYEEDFINIKYITYEKICCRKNKKFSSLNIDILDTIDFSKNLIYYKLINFIVNNDNKPLYNTFKIPKGNGKGFREISEPIEGLKSIMKELNIPLSKAFNSRLIRRESNQCAYIKNRNIVINTNIHKFNDYVIKFDFSHFFDSCKWEYFVKYLNIPNDILDNDYIVDTYIKPAFLNKDTNGLYLGNPVSGTLSNMIIHPVAFYLKNVCRSHNINFSMYADDLTFSSNEKNEYFNVTYLKALINNSLDKFKLNEFKLNEEKTRLLKNNGRRITGIRINHLNQLTIGEKKYKELNVMLYHLSKKEKISIPIHTLQARIIYYLYYDESSKLKKLINKYSNLFEESGPLYLPSNHDDNKTNKNYLKSINSYNFYDFNTIEFSDIVARRVNL